MRSTLLGSLLFLSFALWVNVFAQGGQTLFGDVRVTAEDSLVAVPQEVTLILRRAIEGEIGRQTVSSRGRYRFTNLKTGDYEIIAEVGGKEVVRYDERCPSTDRSGRA